jgi:hypothetical protein
MVMALMKVDVEASLSQAFFSSPLDGVVVFKIYQWRCYDGRSPTWRRVGRIDGGG